MLELKALEVKDFSGGITDYYMQGDPKRYQRAVNLTINNDKNFDLRDGSIGFDSSGNHRITDSIRRIDKFLLFNNRTELFPQQERDVYYLNSTPTWTRLTGPSGNESLGAGQSYDSVSSTEWASHLYLTSTAGPIPSKIYRDENGVLQVRTVGLPIPKYNPRYNDATLLASCITLANDLRTQMIAHINDTTLHPGYVPGVKDEYSLSYFETQSFSGLEPEIPNPIPTPAPLATDEATLYTLITALVNAYNHHGYDLENTYYHQDFTYKGVDGSSSRPPKGPYEKIKSNPSPDNLEDAALTLDELKMKYTFHVFSLYGHNSLNTYSSMNYYTITTPSIGNTDTVGVPFITENYDDFIRYVNYLKNLYNLHVSNGIDGADWNASPTPAQYHTQPQNTENYTLCTLPDASDLTSAYLIIYWIWALYGLMHMEDANNPVHTFFTMDTSAGSANVTDVKTTGAITLPVGNWVTAFTDIFTDVSGNQRTAKVTASGSGTATLSKKAVGTVNDQSVQHSSSYYHALTSSNLSQTAFESDADELIDPAPGRKLQGPNITLPATIEAWVTRAQQVFQAIFNHVSNTDYHFSSTTFGSFLSGNGPFFLPEMESVAYAFTFKDTYTVESGTEFEIISEPRFIGPFETGKVYPSDTALDTGITGFDTNDDSMSGAISTKVLNISSISISNLPVITNDSTTNYATSNIDVQIYRTVDSGNTYYLVDEVDNGTTTYTDSVADTLSAPGLDSLDTRELLYTTGGVAPNTQPPNSKFLHILQGTAYYGAVTDGDQYFGNRVLQSIPGTIEGAPSTFFDDLEDDLTGISSVRNNVIALCRHSIYRLNGGFTKKSSGALTHEKISDTLGCISSQSIVQTEVGIFFAGTDGFYYTDGFQLIPISIDLSISYASLTETTEQAERISGSYDRRTRRIWWTAQKNPTDTDCDVVYVYYLNYGIKPSGVFTTAENGEYFRPSAITFFNNQMIRGDMRGLIFKHDSIYKTDPKVPSDVTTSYASWGFVYIPYDYTSCALDFGTIYEGQWVTKIHLLGNNAGNTNLQINSIADNTNNNSNKKPLAPIQYNDNIRWGDARLNWGDTDIIWQYDGKFDFWRRFTSKTLRSQLKQVQMVPAFIGVYRYDDFPEFSYCNVDDVAKTATILTPTDFDDILWPLDVVDMYIAFSGDGYENEFLITSVTDDVITFSDDDDLSVTSSDQEWVIRGYQKEAGFSPLSYSIEYANFGKRGRRYMGEESRGENG
jgi:hypothetical protein